jgi:hypothetical protein
MIPWSTDCNCCANVSWDISGWFLRLWSIRELAAPAKRGDCLERDKKLSWTSLKTCPTFYCRLLFDLYTFFFFWVAKAMLLL